MFVINGQPKDIGGFPESKDAAPEGGETAYVDTWALGKLRAGEERTFKWSVTAVRAGDYKLEYEVAAGLDGKAKAVGVGGAAPARAVRRHDLRRPAGHPRGRRRQARSCAARASPHRAPRLRPARRSYPRHSSTGTRGYFGNAGSVFDRSHIENELPRVLRMTFWWRQVSQRPGSGDGTDRVCRRQGERPRHHFRHTYKATRARSD